MQRPPQVRAEEYGAEQALDDVGNILAGTAEANLLVEACDREWWIVVMRARIACSDELLELHFHAKPVEVQISDEGVLHHYDAALVGLRVHFELVISQGRRRQLQNRVTVGLECLIVLARASEAGTAGRPDGELRVDWDVQHAQHLGRVKAPLEEAQDGRQLTRPLPLRRRQIVLVDVVGRKDRHALVRRDVVPLLVLALHVLLAIRPPGAHEQVVLKHLLLVDRLRWVQ